MRSILFSFLPYSKINNLILYYGLLFVNASPCGSTAGSYGAVLQAAAAAINGEGRRHRADAAPYCMAGRA